MGGKKQSQRTKNNARPSSSGRSAELLNSQVRIGDGLSSTAIFPSAAAANIPTLFPSLAGNVIDTGLSSEFQLCFKRLNKKDPVTKTKALQELTELVNNSKVDDVVLILPTWAHFYKMLTIDLDRKVREATQLCHLSIVKSCGRRLAPQLRAIAPHWLLAQYDDHAPAQTHAYNSLTSTFPDNKLPELISYCREEIMAVIMENLLGAADDVINKKVAEEEREAALSRARISALSALRLVAVKLAGQTQWLKSALQPLEGHAPFWKLAQHADYNVRCAWYTCVSSVSSSVTDLPLFLCRAASAVATNKETHTTAARHRLSALVFVTHNIQDWYNLIEKKDVFRKRVLEIAESGGYGEAKQTSGLFMQLLNNLPEEMLTQHFYMELFDNAFKALEKKQVMISKSERQHWLNGIIQCILQFTSSENTIDASEAGVKNAVAKLTEIAAIPGNITSNITSIPLKWLPSTSPKISLLLLHFWHSLSCSLLSKLTSPTIELLQSQSQLLHTLKTSIVPKKQKTIKFDGDQPNEITNDLKDQIDSKLIERYNRDLYNLVSKISARYLEIADSDKRNDIISILFGILSEFKLESVINNMAKELNKDNPYKLYEDMIKFWLYDESMGTNDLVNLVFLMMEFMSEEQQTLVFQSFDNVPTQITVWCIQNCSRSNMKTSHVWVRSAGNILRLAAESVSGAAQLMITDKRGDDFLITDEAVTGILRALKERVGKVYQNVHNVGATETEIDEENEREDTDADHDCIIACQAVTMLAAANRTQVTEYDDLILELLRVALNVQAGYSISIDTWRETVSSIQDGVAAITETDRYTLRNNAKDILHEYCFSKTELNINKIEQSTSLCPYLLQFDKEPVNEREIEELTKIMFQSLTETHLQTEIHALQHDCVSIRLNCLHEDDNELIKKIIQNCELKHVEVMTMESFICDANSLVFRVTFLQNILVRDETESDGNDWSDVLLRNEYVLEQLSKVLRDFSVLGSLYDSHAFCHHYQLILDTYTRIKYILEQIIFPSIPEQTFSAFTKHIWELGIEQGYYWSKAAAYLLKYKDCEEIEKFTNSELMESLTGNGYFHTLMWSTESSTDISRLQALYAVMVRSIYISYPSLCDDDFLKDAIMGSSEATPNVVANFYYNKNKLVLLYESKIEPFTWQQVVTAATTLEYLAELVHQKGWNMTTMHWDFVNITLTSIVMNPFTNTKHAMLSRAHTRLLARVSSFLGAYRQRCEIEQPTKDVATMVLEWKDVFLTPATFNFLNLLLNSLESVHKMQMSVSTLSMISGIIEACQSAAASLLNTCESAAEQVWKLWSLAADILSRDAPFPVHYLAYHIMVMTHKAMVLNDAKQLSMWSMRAEEDDVSTPRLAICFLKPAFRILLNTLNDIMEPYQMGTDFVSPTPGTDLHTKCTGLALLWSAVHLMYGVQHTDLQQHYMQLFREERYGELMVYLCVRLCPRNAGTTEQPLPQIQEMFDNRPDPNPYEFPSVTSGYYCHCLRLCLHGWSLPSARVAVLPSKARAWQSAAVCVYVSAGLVSAELQALSDGAHTMDDVQVVIHWSTLEAHITALVEERPIELIVQYSRDHPLTPPKPIAKGKTNIGSNLHWITMYLAYQNGSLSSAISMWLSVVHGAVSRAPQCYICYCRLQPTSGRLPSLPCRQCHNKFHTECIRKWFQSSGKSNCPLCRATF